MKQTGYRLLELFLFFVIIPVSFTLNFLVIIKLGIGLLGFAYIVFVMLRIEKIKLKIAKKISWKRFWRLTLTKLALIVVLTTLYMWIVDPNNLFVVILSKPILWLVIIFIYSFFSVYPQELIYRTFFFKRYKHLFKSEVLFVLVNAALFSLAHLFFKNTLVLILTFLGGILFALTYNNTRSTVLVSIEHAIYGCWLFTVGMGDMLGFPS